MSARRLMPRFFSVLCAGLLALCLTGLTGLSVRAQSTDPDALISAAQADDAKAQTALAGLYHRGEGVMQNYATAAFWAKQAADAGEARAQNLLGRYYHGGLGVEQSQAHALRWLREAAQTGTPQYLEDLAKALEHGADGSSDPAAAARLYAQAAEAGQLESAVSLGMLYQEGKGVAQNFGKARQLYEPAAAQGHARAQNNLGLLYVRGHGVDQDYEKAARLFAAAAEQGLHRAMRNLGVMYENGFGVPLDEARAAELYRLAGQGRPPSETTPMLTYDARLQPLPDTPEQLRQAASAGDPVAQFQLGWSLISVPDPEFAAQAEAARLFRAAAETGYGPAMRNLGLLYFKGRAVPQDYVLARMWLTLAAQAGQADTSALIEMLDARMTTDQINDAQTRATARSK